MISLFQELSFNIELSSMVGPKIALVSIIGRAIVKKLAVKFKGNEILDMDDFDIFACYRDLWNTESEKQKAGRQRIIHSGGCTLNCMKLRINASDKDDTATQEMGLLPTHMGISLSSPLRL